MPWNLIWSDPDLQNKIFPSQDPTKVVKFVVYYRGVAYILALVIFFWRPLVAEYKAGPH